MPATFMTKAKPAFAATTAALALALSACSDAPEDTAELEGEPIAAIAAPDGGSWLDTAVQTEDGGYRIGNPDAPLKLVEYASHTCGACAAFSAQGAPALEEEYVTSGVVSYEVRNLIRDPLDMTISVLARCGADEAYHPRANAAWAALGEFSQNLSGEKYQAAMAQPIEQRFVAIAEGAGLIEFFATRGLSTDQARQCLADVDNINAIAERSEASASEANVTATPTFFLNGARIDGSQWPTVEPALQRAGAR